MWLLASAKSKGRSRGVPQPFCLSCASAQVPRTPAKWLEDATPKHVKQHSSPASARLVMTAPDVSEQQQRELLLLAALVYAHDRWQASTQRQELKEDDHTRRRASTATMPWCVPGKSLAVMSITAKDTTATSSHSPAEEHAEAHIGTEPAAPSAAPPAVGRTTSPASKALATTEKRMHSGADSTGSGATAASNASDMIARGYEDNNQSDDPTLLRRGGGGSSLLFSSSICMSRGAVESAQNLAFSSASGELQLRRDTLFHVLRHWSDCSLQLSVLTGQLLVQRKSKPETDIFPLVLYTGSSIHRKRANVFKLVFYGHEPLHFRTTEPRDAELWVKALEYAKESTWHLWT